MRILMTYINISLFLLLSNVVQAQTEDGAEVVKTGEYQKTNDPDADELTLEEARQASEFVNDAYIQRKMQEACGEDEDTQKACAGIEANVFGEMEDNLIKAAAMALSMFSLGSSKITQREGSVPEAATGEEQAEPKEQEDYCRFIPIGTVMVGQIMQSSRQQSIQTRLQLEQQGFRTRDSDPDTVRQASALYAQAESHDGRAEGNKIESMGYGATVGCYVILTTTSGIGLTNVGTGTYVKMGAAGFLAWFYNRMASKNKEYAQKVRDIADALPGKGDCNPITDKPCYCAQPETMNDPQYCVELPQGIAASSSGFVIPTGCVNRNGQQDPQCRCRASNACLDQMVAPLFDIPGASNTALAGTVRNALRPFNNSLNSANLTSGDASQGAFRVLKKIDDKLPKKPLNAEQAKLAKTFAKAGLPPNLARNLATQKTNSFGLNAAKNLASAPKVDTAPTTKSFKGGDAAVLNYKSKSRSSRSTSSGGFKNPFAKKAGAQAGNPNVLHYANKASAAAARRSINRDSGKNVFDIISYRYQKSGFQALSLELE